MATIGELAVNVVANTGGLDRGLNQSRQSIASFVGSMGLATGSIARFIPQVAAAAGALVGLGSAAGAVSMGVRLAAEAEQTQVAFEVMLGSASRAQSMLAELRDFANTTPFSLAGLNNATKTLLQFGVAADDVMPTIRMLGDVASGDEVKLSQVALVFGQIASTGRLMGQDLLQLINVGFNPLQTISDRTGESMAALKKRMEQGKISFDEVRQAFTDVTSAGGRFFEMTAKQGQTLGGQWSTFQDAIQNTLLKFGNMVVGGGNLKGTLEGLSGAVDNFTAGLELAGPALQESFAAVSLAISETITEIMNVEDPIEAWKIALDGVAWTFQTIAQTVELIKIGLLSAKASALTLAELVTMAGGKTLGAAGARQDVIDAINRASVTDRTRGVGSARAAAEEAAGGAKSLKSTLTDQDAAFAEHVKFLGEEAKKFAKDGQKIFESTRTPVEKFRAEMEHLKLLYDRNAISITTFFRAATDARQKFDAQIASQRKNDPQFQAREELRKAAQERQKALRDEAADANAAYQSPLKTFGQEIAHLVELSRAGLSREALAGKRKEIFDRAREGLGQSGPTQFAGAALKGTQEAFSAILKAGAQDQQLEEQRRQTAWLAKIEAAILGRKPVQVASLGP